MSQKKAPKILIVDDEDDIRDIMKYELEKHGFKVIDAPCGNKAYELLKSDSSIQVVVSDVRMSDGSGLELLEKVRNQNLEKPYFILFTGNCDISSDEAYGLGANSLIFKPIEFDLLAEVIKHFTLPQDERLQRRFYRGNIKLDIETSISNLKDLKQGQTINIGRGGMFLTLEGELPLKGDHITFKINNEENPKHSLEGVAVVRWTREKAEKDLPRGIGLEFINLSQASINQLLKLLTDMTIKSYIPRS